MADTVERLPFPISKRLASTVTEITARNGREIHYTIAGIPFRVATSPQMPLTLETAPQQKQQTDQEPEAGEQTLSGWWLRSQASWHEGAGARFTETGIGQSLRVDATNGFWESSNVDPWTQGELRLLKATVDAGGTTNRSVAIIPDSTAHSIVAGRVGSVVRYTNLDVGAATTDLYVNGAITFTQVIATETAWYAAGNDGQVYSGPIGSTTTSPSVWSLTTASTNPTRILFAKHRLWACNDNKIYMLDAATPGATAVAYFHPSTSWTYTDLTDGPGGVYFSGYGDGTSHIQRVTLDDTGSVPSLSGAVTLAVLPSDEKALRINSIAGSLVCILTNMGVRCASADTSGNLTYGPLFIERDTELAETAKPALTSAGRFWWLSFGDEHNTWRIDSSVEIEEGVFAYASDMESLSFPIGISVRKGRGVIATLGGAVQYQHATDLCAEGFIQTGRVRYRTDELKTYHYVDVTAQPLEGSLTLDLLNDSDSESRIITWDVQGHTLPTVNVPSTMSTQRFMSVKLTFLRDTDDHSLGPVVFGVRVKALPASLPQRIYTLPLLCYDEEQWSSGQFEGYKGYARDRYLSLRAAEDAGGIVVLANFNFPEPTGELCRIEEMKFVQLQQPDTRQISGGLEGLLVVTLRTLT